MPPQNSPNGFDFDAFLAGPASPQLTSSTRLPIITDEEIGEDDSAALRRLLERRRTIEQPSESRWSSNPIDQATREEFRRRANARRSDFAHRSTMSTYRGWAPGTIEFEDPLRSPLSRQPLRNDPSHRNTATRRYRREQEMTPAARTNPHSINEEREPNTMEWQPTLPSMRDSAPTRFDSNPLRTAALLESLRRRTRAEMLRDGINSTSAGREYDQDLQQLNLLDEYNQLTNDLELSNHSRQHQASQAESEETDDEKHMIKLFEEAIIFLDGLRSCITSVDRFTVLKSLPILTDAIDSGVGASGYAPVVANIRNFDTAVIKKPQPSSWLRPGASFLGQQKASIASGTVRLNRRSRRGRIVSQNETTQSETSRPWTHGIVSAGSLEPVKDCWPVKVTITSVDYNNMTLTGTMEAFNVPNAKGTNLVPRDPNVSSITTYLEGEIIDLHKHSLRTTNFKAGSGVDATYWRKLEPFKSFEAESIVDGFTHTEWLSEELIDNWIIMRWKEKCFISPSDSNSGLTISGFYYITLKRSNGSIEGLYHDPLSCPYQHLNLLPEKPVFPVYAFR